MTTPNTPKIEPSAHLETRSFTESSEALNKILERMRSDSLPLEEALALFEEGIEHLKNCQSKLATSKAKVEVLMGELQSDEPLSSAPFDL